MELSASATLAMAPPPGIAGEVAFAAFLYYREARNLACSPADIALWLDNLPADSRAQFARQNLSTQQLPKACKRFLLERRGLLMADYMAARLSSTAFAYWCATADEFDW